MERRRSACEGRRAAWSQGRSRRFGQGGFLAIPGTDFDEREQPLVQVPAADVRPEVADLLLARAPDFFNIVEVFFQSPARRDGFEDLAHADRRSGAEVRSPSAVFEANDDHADQSARQF